ncbi:MAG TPA: hypothetical protein PKX93_06645, partial [bacterium]|nr:hypothetical protein [bacterium]
NWMEKEGVSFNGLHCQIVCPARLNTLITRGDSKSFIDFSCFAQVIRHLAVPGVKIQAGKIGGTKNYLTWLRYAFPEATIKPLEESHGLSSYQVSLSGKTYNLEFWVDVEEKSLAAAVASLIGKFVRELFMESINKALDNQVPVSGYRDRKTKVFLSRILPRLPEKKIPVSCLVRKA